MIFVTDDRKEDWWLKVEGKVIGPHPELLQEIATQAGIMFYMYSADPFMKYAGKYLNQKVEKKAIDEVRELRQRDEKLISLTTAFIRRAIEDSENLKRSLMASPASDATKQDETDSSDIGKKDK